MFCIIPFIVIIMDFVDSKSANLFPSYYLQRDEEAIRSRRRHRMFRHVTVLITSFFLLGWVIKHIPHTKQEYLPFFHVSLLLAYR